MKTIIPAFGAKWLIRHLNIFGLEPGDLFDGTGLDSAWLYDEKASITMDDYLQLIVNALKKTEEPALGLKIGQWYSLQEQGVWGYAILCSSNARDAINTALKYWELNGPLVHSSYEVDEANFIWEIIPAFHHEDPRLMIYAVEELISTVYEAARVLFERSLDIVEVLLSYPPPHYSHLYSELFNAPVRFSADKNAMVLSKDFLDMPTITGQASLKEICEKFCQSLIQNLEARDELVDSIRKIIIESASHFPKADQVAKRLNISPRTLFRRLQERETSYQALLDEVRTELSMEYLKKTTLTIEQISELVGFSESTTFRQTFKKWTGMSPSEFRKR
jgi:AraC-like DNA-binding protein